MEHSVLHALGMIGMVIALGGVFLVLGLVRPAQRSSGPETMELAGALSRSAARWVFRGAVIAALATLLNFFVDVAEARGQTVFSPVDLPTVAQFAAETYVGRLSLTRVGVLLLVAAGVALLPGRWKWWFAGAGAFTAVVLASMVSHAAAQPEARLVVVAAQVAHTTAAALWVGVLIHLLAARSSLQGGAGEKGVVLVAEIVRRFSPVALTVTSLLALSGLFMLYRFLGGWGGFRGAPVSAYGLTLMIKLLMLVPALYAGMMNFSVIRPALLSLAGAGTAPAAPETKTPILRRFGGLLELEVTAGVMVLLVAGILASVSPPGEAGAYRLTPEQEQAVLSPRFPTSSVVNPAMFYGAATRDLDDLRYSEFTHHWSGVMVCLLGLGWLAQSARGRLGKWAAYGWPFLLVPFALFVAVASDPEVWLLRRVSLREAIADPQLLEHQLGAVMILVLVWLGWRDHRKPPENRPLGYALPVIFILGGVLLLGHAHSTLTATDEVLNLINYQHAIFGAFILCAGAIRWLGLRNLIPRRAANLAWPCFIIGLGLFMTFFYRETI